MTTPHDPQRQGQPNQGPYGGQQGPYGPPQGQPPGQYGPPYGGPEQYGPPPGQYGQQGGYGPPGQYGGPQQFDHGPAQQPYVYNPYGASSPAGLRQEDLAPVGRPGLLILAFIMLVIATLPFLLGGAAALISPPSPGDIPASVLSDPRLAAAGVTPETLISIVRMVGAIVLIIAMAYLMFALFALTGKNWARIIVTILTTIFVLLLLLGTPFSSLSAVGLIFFLGIIALSVGGVVLMFIPAARRFFASARR